MRTLAPVEEKIRRAIRDARAKGLLISIVALQETLERQFNRTFTREYLARLSDKVARQTLMEIDRARIEERMNFTRENYRMVREKLIEIMYWDKYAHPGERPPQKRDIVEAAKSVAMLDLALLKAEIETGMYKKPIAEIAKEYQYDPLPPEVRAVVIAAWARGGLLPRAASTRATVSTAASPAARLAKPVHPQ
jgi:hypothetical protein